jgi:hypothetical protein
MRVNTVVCAEIVKLFTITHVHCHWNYNKIFVLTLSLQRAQFKKYGISCHKNTKFLHTIAEGFLYLMYKKWNSYVYLKPNTTIGNFEAGLSNFVVTIHPPQFTHCAEIRFLRCCLWKSIVTFTSSNSFLCISIQNTAQHKVLHSIFSSTL